jgi:hypothetical protein
MLLLPAVFSIALCGVATSSAFATEDPYYKVGGARLKSGATTEVGLKAVSNQVFKTSSAGITITCTGVAASKGSTLNGSDAGEPGTSAGKIEYSGCTVAGNGANCEVTAKAIVTNALKDELELATDAPVIGTKILDLFKAASGGVIATINFVGSDCKISQTSLEGTFDVEILNSAKQTVGFGVNQKEEDFGFVKALPNGQEECKLKGSKLDKCTKSNLKAFGLATTLEGTIEVFLTGKDAGTKFGVFSS